MLQVQILSPLASHVGYLNALTSLTFMRNIITWMQPISLEVYFMPLIEMFSRFRSIFKILALLHLPPL